MVLSSRESPVIDKSKVLEAFEGEVLNTRVDCQDAKLWKALQNSINHDLDGIDSDTPTGDQFPGTLHCKAVLAAIGGYPHLAILNGDEKLLNIAKVVTCLADYLLRVPHSLTLLCW
jgi:hypothetical protein